MKERNGSSRSAAHQVALVPMRFHASRGTECADASTAPCPLETAASSRFPHVKEPAI
jgi:hypothetical protein